MKLYRSREGDITTVDTKTQLTTLGSETAPGPLMVPAGAKSIKAVISAIANNFAVASDGVILIRLEGPGLPEGPETIAVGASGAAVATGGKGSFQPMRLEIDIPVTPANEILVFAENAGEDLGTVSVGVTLEFTS